jgi:hypothetical protein
VCPIQVCCKSSASDGTRKCTERSIAGRSTQSALYGHRQAGN